MTSLRDKKVLCVADLVILRTILVIKALLKILAMNGILRIIIIRMKNVDYRFDYKFNDKNDHGNYGDIKKHHQH